MKVNTKIKDHNVKSKKFHEFKKKPFFLLKNPNAKIFKVSSPVKQMNETVFMICLPIPYSKDTICNANVIKIIRIEKKSKYLWVLIR